ncbi:MAG: hypothetical protein HC803_06475 [Saprospiraceae bacterium]|nr:hypothetical protein [Saprospiraceae bacterium]
MTTVFNSNFNNHYTNRNNIPFVIPNNEVIATIEQSNNATVKQSNNATVKQSNNATIEQLKQLNLVLDNVNTANSKWWETPENSNDGKRRLTFGERKSLIVEAAKPTNYQIGIAGQFSNISTANGIKPIGILNVGINGNTTFFNHLRLGIGAEKWTQFVHFENIEAVADGSYGNVFSDLTTLNPYNPQDDLTKLEGQIHGLDFPLSAAILLRPDAKFNPYLGFGIVGRYYGKYKFEQYFYEYGNPIYRYEIKDEGTVKQFDLSLWQTKVGLDFKLSQNGY